MKRGRGRVDGGKKPPQPPPAGPDRLRVALAIVLAVAFAELVRTAWISDDAAITLRTVLNFLHGYGPRFNVDERVQAFTHPLWFLAISGTSAITGNVFVATFLLSFVSALATLWFLVRRVARDVRAGLLAAGVLVLSKAWVDFSTSGLENPLSHFLVLVTFVLGAAALDDPRGPALRAFFLAAGLLFLNRPDLPLLFLPLAAVLVFRSRSAPGRVAAAAGVGALPVAAWTLFSLFYYGAAVPNTAFAKLGHGLAPAELLAQGTRYLSDSLARDPLTLTAIAVGVVIGARSTLPDAAAAAGVVLYLSYVVAIGGDFMSGRFLTPALALAAALLARARLANAAVWGLALGAGVLGVLNARTTVLSGAGYADKVIPESGIADERGFWFPEYGLVTAPRATWRTPRWEVGTRAVSVRGGGLGYAGIEAGPGLHIVDACALADPLLARLPAVRDPNWRIGHFDRRIPAGYVETLMSGRNVIADPRTRAFDDVIRLVTRAPLNAPGRLAAIVDLNLGRVEKPDMAFYRDGAAP